MLSQILCDGANIRIICQKFKLFAYIFRKECVNSLFYRQNNKDGTVSCDITPWYDGIVVVGRKMHSGTDLLCTEQQGFLPIEEWHVAVRETTFLSSGIQKFRSLDV